MNDSDIKRDGQEFVSAIAKIIRGSEKSDLEKGFILGVIHGIDFKADAEKANKGSEG